MLYWVHCELKAPNVARLLVDAHQHHREALSLGLHFRELRIDTTR